MPLFQYKAINENGNTVSGEIEAPSKAAAQEQIASQGYIPESVKKKAAKSSGSDLGLLTPPVKAADMIIFTKQFRTLLQAGISILRIFEILELQTENRRLKKATTQMTDEVKQGGTLHSAFSAHRKVFNRLYCAMIKAGEQSGSLPEVLERLIYITEHEEKVKKDIKAAVRYPLIVLFFLFVAFFILLTFVVPKFVGIFQRAGLDLPLPTRICMAMYNGMMDYWPVMLIGLAGTVIFLVQYVKTSQGRFLRDAFVMALPIVGPVFVKSAMSRFASIFSILQSSGINVLETMRILGETLNNAAITREFDKIQEKLEEGRGISGPLSQARYFTPMVINMVAIGEESGNLDDMLREVAAHYDTEVEYATKGLSDALGPILMVGLTAVVGFFAFAIFLPMWDLTQMV